MGKIAPGLIDIELQPQGGQTADAAALPSNCARPSWRARCRRVTACRRAGMLARQLEVSRNTVSLVVDQLAMEGYLAYRRRTASDRSRPACHGRRLVIRARRNPSPAARRFAAFALGGAACGKSDWPLRPCTRAPRGRFSRASPMRARFRTTSGRDVCAARPRDAHGVGSGRH